MVGDGPLQAAQQPMQHQEGHMVGGSPLQAAQQQMQHQEGHMVGGGSQQEQAGQPELPAACLQPAAPLQLPSALELPALPAQNEQQQQQLAPQYNELGSGQQQQHQPPPADPAAAWRQQGADMGLHWQGRGCPVGVMQLTMVRGPISATGHAMLCDMPPQLGPAPGGTFGTVGQATFCVSRGPSGGGCFAEAKQGQLVALKQLRQAVPGTILSREQQLRAASAQLNKNLVAAFQEASLAKQAAARSRYIVRVHSVGLLLSGDAAWQLFKQQPAPHEASLQALSKWCEAMKELAAQIVCGMISGGASACIVMEHMAYGTLQDLQLQRPLLLSDVRSIVTSLANGLFGTHSVGLVHRDVKPLNVMLWRGSSSDAALEVKLADFGQCKEVEIGAPRSDTCCGTLDYMVGGLGGVPCPATLQPPAAVPHSTTMPQTTPPPASA